MKTFNITITSKNKNSINQFFLFFNKNTMCDSNFIFKYFQKKVEKKKLTILKSPHVNKKAQEQFETRFFKKQFQIQITKNLKYLIFLKKLNSDLFPDTNLILKCSINSKNMLPFVLKIYNLNNFKINKYTNILIQNLNLKNLKQQTIYTDLWQYKLLIKIKIIKLLKVLELYGEFSSKNLF